MKTYPKSFLSSFCNSRFGDEGCVQLCTGLEGNSTLIKLSLKFCSLTAVSGVCLGKTISETAIRCESNLSLQLQANFRD